MDSPSIIVGAIKNKGSDNVVLFLWDDSYRHDMISIGFSNVYKLPLAADESIFKAIKLSKKAYRRYYSQAAFVGNSMVDAYRWQVRKIPEGFNEIVEEMARLLSKKRISFGEVLNLQDARTVARLNELSEKDLGALEAAVYWRATMIHRLKAVRRLGEFSPVIYGDDGWKELLDDSYDLRKKVNYYDVLPLVYNATDINFNATSLQMREAVNQRVFDVPACGAFLLTDHQSAIEELFDVGKEVITYKDKEEIPELVKYYLNHGDERKKIAASARDRVLREHTYKHRVRKIIEVMKKRFG
ncbi:spore protein YkvP [bacterium BMS3Abin08]|nr:spore protein YkvP [bacterium BMS3Abin08]